MNNAISASPNKHSLPPGTYYGSGPVCDIHTYYGPQGAEVTLKRKYALWGANPAPTLPTQTTAEELSEILSTYGEAVTVAQRGRLR